MKRSLLCLCFLFLSQLLHAQQTNIEKLAAKLLNGRLNKIDKIDTINRIIEINNKQNYFFYDSLANKILKLSQAEKYKKGEATTLLNLANINEATGKLNQAHENAKTAIAILETLINDRKKELLLAKANLILGQILRRKGYKGDATKAFIKTIQYAEKVKADELVASGYRGLGVVYVLEKDYEKALNYFYRAININKKINNKLNLSANYTNIGIVFLRQKKYDQSLAAHQNALKLALVLKNESRISFVYNDIGATSLYKGDLDKAIFYLQKSIAIRELLHEKNEIAYTYNYLGEAYNKKGNFIEAEKWIQKALATAIAIGNNKQHYEALESLSDFYAANKKYTEAYTYLSKYKVYRDSIATIERKEAIDELVTQYETEKKEQQIKSLSQETRIQKLEIKQRNILLIIAVFLLIAVIAVSYLLYNQRKLKAKATLQEEINKQQDLAAKAVLEAEERERRRIAVDLHDGVGQLLSAALMNMNALFHKLNLTGDNNEQAKHTLAIVNESYEEMRSISHQMMPNALTKSGLASAVKEFLNKIDKDVIKVSLETIGLNERLSEQKETILYRIIQETVNNVIKHSGANKLTISIIQDDEGISATIEDNGKGFDKSNFTSGIGISNMQSRVEFLKGIIDIDTAPNKGTLIAVFIPK